MTSAELFKFDLDRLVKKVDEIKKNERPDTILDNSLKAVRDAYRLLEDATTIATIALKKDK